MECYRRASGNPASLGVFPGTFNPPTKAHLAVVRAALRVVDEVVCVLPRVFPHKEYAGASFEERIRMLEAALAGEPRVSIASSEHGLFIDIARECRAAYGESVELYFLCGRDAAERIVAWDYGQPGAFAEQLREYQLLVAPRGGPYEPPPEFRSRIHPLPMEGDYDAFSATEVRERIRDGRPWRHLVPDSIADMVEGIYSR